MHRLAVYFAAILSAQLIAPGADVTLEGLRVRLGTPVQVTAQLGWEEGGHWAFIHATPTMARFATGELIVTYTLVPDTNQNPKNGTGLQISTDGGKTWGHRYEIIPEHQPMIFSPLSGNALLAIPAYLYQRTPGDEHNFYASYTRMEQGGRRIMFEPGAVKVVDWPWPVDVYKSVSPRSNWLAQLCFDGNAIEVNGHLLATAYGTKKGEKFFRSVVLISEDKGYTWRYHGTIADMSTVPPLPREGLEGPCETSMIQLASGELMAVFRVGSGKQFPLHRAYSRDGGRTWTRADALPAYSVEPSLLRLRNGVIALSSGRPDIRLWLSTDPRGARWQDVDLLAHHNAWAPDPTYRIEPRPGYPASSCYTEMVETAPNKVLLVYDRGVRPRPQNDRDLTRVFVMPIEVSR